MEIARDVLVDGPPRQRREAIGLDQDDAVLVLQVPVDDQGGVRGITVRCGEKSAA